MKWPLTSWHKKEFSFLHIPCCLMDSHNKRTNWYMEYLNTEKIKLAITVIFKSSYSGHETYTCHWDTKLSDWQVSVIILHSLERKVRLIRLPFCLSVHLSVYSPLITFEPVSRFLWNSVGSSCHWRWPWYHTLNPISSTIKKWSMFKHLRWM
jgi:hypothetical protein